MLHFTLLVPIWSLVAEFSLAADVDPEAFMTAPEMIRYWGYPVEVHDVITADGYILDLFRIPHGRSSDANSSCHRPAVLFVHGLTGSATLFLVNPPESNPAFILADAGFDVFLLNHRGTTYGKRHTSLRQWDNKFWQFTLDEYAKYDAPAVIDKALELTGQSSLYWIGLSQGTLVGFMTLAENPGYNNKASNAYSMPNFNKRQRLQVNSLFQLGPVGTAGYAKGFVRFIFFAYKTFKPVVDLYRYVLGSHEIAWQWGVVFRPLVQLCSAIPLLSREICNDGLELITGHTTRTFNWTRVPVYVTHLPCGTSTWNFLHWGQIATRLKIEHMDHNPMENMQRYGQETPPPYNYSQIESPVYLFWSGTDWLSTTGDIEHIILRLLRKDVGKGSVEIPGYNHGDFSLASDCGEMVFNPIARIVREQENNMCSR